ncbi:Tim44 domain-containing protein [Sphingomonas abietis]|uniref:TIM44-like domain-containing protein n=1 Tax=Sphingomonas abietis TaxID=3012344 RepID=A0ABY7NRT5_9SPHN|nr:TIM44-like domain-containing protein [Sphingomonas abietis]WBO24252.1 TIM44-like domain-containing protein [Sphingomonas abietis]
MSSMMTLLAVASLATGPADARRGGSFGSRGSRTYSAPPSTYGSQRYVPPVQRSMTPRGTPQPSPNYAPAYGQQPGYRPAGSRFGGFGGGLLGGLVAGGLIGHFFGHGMGGGWGGAGGGGGFLTALLQVAILGGIVWLVIGFFRRRSQSQGSPMNGGYSQQDSYVPQGNATVGSPWGGPAMAPQPVADQGVDIAITSSDQQAFERLLIDVQDAFGREDYGRLRQLTTPEIMSYLSEELSQNATQGIRNEVSGTRLLDAEVSEAWQEAGADYATIALRYEGIDLMRNRTTGAIVSGSANIPSETTELWTFVRDMSGTWKLSAIQES